MIHQHLYFIDPGEETSFEVLDSEARELKGITAKELGSGTLGTTTRSLQAGKRLGSITLGLHQESMDSLLEVLWPFVEKLHEASHNDDEQNEFHCDKDEERLHTAVLGLVTWFYLARKAQCFEDTHARLVFYVGSEQKGKKALSRQVRDPETDEVFTYFVSRHQEPLVVGQIPLPCNVKDVDKKTLYKEALEDSAYEHEGFALQAWEQAHEEASQRFASRFGGSADFDGEMTLEEAEALDVAILPVSFSGSEWVFLRSVALMFGIPFHDCRTWLREIFKTLAAIAFFHQQWEGPRLRVGLQTSSRLLPLSRVFFNAGMSLS
jgi:hypothetical protein